MQPEIQELYVQYIFFPTLLVSIDLLTLNDEVVVGLELKMGNRLVSRTKAIKTRQSLQEFVANTVSTFVTN